MSSHAAESSSNFDSSGKSGELRTAAEKHVWTGTSSQWVNIKIYLVCLLLCWLIVPIFIAIWYWLVVRSKTFELTTQRLKTTDGVLNRHTDELELYRVKDTTMSQDVFQRMLGLATVHLTTSDPTTPNLDISSVKLTQANFLREQIRELTEELRDRKRVREVD
jgi:uncharacterized membrane protein YdbT with pleckstrin-like domain